MRQASDSLNVGGYAGLYADWGESFVSEPGYHRHSSGLPVAFKVGDALPETIEEQWRRV
jgi:hypothetical protein